MTTTLSFNVPGRHISITRGMYGVFEITVKSNCGSVESVSWQAHSAVHASNSLAAYLLDNKMKMVNAWLNFCVNCDE